MTLDRAASPSSGLFSVIYPAIASAWTVATKSHQRPIVALPFRTFWIAIRPRNGPISERAIAPWDVLKARALVLSELELYPRLLR